VCFYLHNRFFDNAAKFQINVTVSSGNIHSQVKIAGPDRQKADIIHGSITPIPGLIRCVGVNKFFDLFSEIHNHSNILLGEKNVDYN